MLKTKRVYENTASGDGTRFLVDYLWPPGIKKEKLKREAWLKDVAPALSCANGSRMTTQEKP